MKIENEIFQFHPNCKFDQLQLSDLQKQYLADLRNQNSIQDLTERYLTNGWLVNFHLLYDLTAMLAKHHWILNPSINNYFANLRIPNSTSAPGRPNAHAQANSAVSSKTGAYGHKNANASAAGNPSAPVQGQNPAPTRVQTSFSNEQLLRLPFFRSLQPELAQFLLAQGYVCKYNAETLVCKSGESSRDLYVLLKGELGVYTQAVTFKQFISILPESSVFGEAGFLLGEKRTADVIALRTSEVLVIPYQADVLDRFLNKEKAQSLQQRFWVQHALLHSDFFKNTPSDCLDALTFSGQIEDFADQQIVFNQGDLGQTAYIVIQGSLLVMQSGQVINTLTQGSFFGEISLMMNDGRRTATVVAQRNTKLLKIQRNEFYRLLAKNLYLAKEFQLLADQRLERDAQRLQRS